MKIVFVNTRYWPAIGGVENSIKSISTVLSDKHTVKVICALNRNVIPTLARLSFFAPHLDKYYDNKIEVIPLNPNAKDRFSVLPAMVYYIPKLRRYFYNQLLWLSIKNYKWVFKNRLKQIISKSDIVHSHTSGHLGWAAYEAAKELDIAFVITPHMHKGQYGDGPADIALYKNADSVIALSEPEKNFYVTAGVKEKNIFIVGETASMTETDSVEELRRRYDLGGYKIITFLGRKQAYKGVLELRKAAGEVWKKFPKTKFLFIGPHYKECDIDMADERIISLEGISDEEKNSLIELSDIICLPSQFESFGIVILEAWAHKKPVIVSNIETLKHLVQNGTDGLMIKPKANYIAEAVIKLLENKSLAQQLGQNGFKKYQEHFTPDIILDRYLNIYQEMLKRTA